MSVLNFDKNSLKYGSMGGALITSAVISMNVGVNRPVSIAMFTAGWILIIKSFNNKKDRDPQTNNIMSFSAVTVWASAIMLRMMLDAGVKGLPMVAGGVVFMGAWLTIGEKVNSRMTPESLNKLYGFIVPVLVFASMASINMFERPNGIASGPGVFMFSSAWYALSLMNSLL